MTIDEYLEALRTRLPWFGRRRALAEVREHLRDSAARHRASGLDPGAAEREAVQDFGDVDALAPRFAAEAAVLETRVATALALGAVACFVFPLYVVPENTLPPAEWVEKPRDILVLQLLSIALWAAAGVLVAVSAILAWTRWSRLAASVLDLVPLALAGSILVSAALVARWFAAGSGIVWWPLLAAPLAAASLFACVGAAGWAHSRRCRLVPD